MAKPKAKASAKSTTKGKPAGKTSKRAAKAQPAAPRGAPARRSLRRAAAPPIPLDELRRIPAFANLSDGDAADLLSVSSVRDLARGDVVFTEGQLGDGLYAILSGSVNVVKRNAKGGERVVATLGVNEIFGEMDLISDRPHTSGIRGAEGTRLLFLPKTEFQRMLRAGSAGATAMVCYFAVMLAGRLDANNRRMISVLDEGAPERRTSEFAEFKRRLLKDWTF